MSFDQKEIFSLMYKLARLIVPDTRVEYDAQGAIHVPLDRMYGPLTMRSLTKFPIGGTEERMPVGEVLFQKVYLFKNEKQTHSVR